MSIYLGNTKIFNPQIINKRDIEKENLFLNKEVVTYTDNKVNKIREYAFAYCFSLQSVNLPNASYIGNNAFYYCDSLQSVNLPIASYIESSAFYECTSLTDVSIPKYSFTSSIFSASPLVNLQIGNTELTSDLTSELAYFVNTLQRIDFAKVTTVPGGYFQSWPLKEIKGSQITSISTNGVIDCSQLTSISFPMASYIGNGAFARCYSLSAVDLPMAEYIGNDAFLNDSAITLTNLPRVSYIGHAAFAGCYPLSTVDLPMAEYIGDEAFTYCRNLLSVYLTGSSICSLADTNAFAQTPISNYTTSTGGRYGSIYVPASLYNSYKTATNWTVYSSRFVSI